MNIPFMKDEEVPTKEFYEKAFKELEGVSKTLDSKRLMKIFLKLFGTKPPIFLFLSNADYLKAFCGYRVISEVEMKRLSFLKPTRVKSFSHPTKSRTTAQRFNINKHPALYLSDSPHTAIEEKKLKHGDLIYVSKWELKKFDQICYVNFLSGKEHIDFKGISENFKSKLDSLIQDYSADKKDSLRYVIEKVISLSLKDEPNNITSLFGHYYLHELAEKIKPSIGFITYPSIRKDGIGINYAINQKLISDSILECTEVKMLRINNHSKVGSWLSIQEIGIVDKRKVIWKKCGVEVYSVIFFDQKDTAFLKFNSTELENMNSDGRELIKSLVSIVMRKYEGELVNYAKDPNGFIEKTELVGLPEGYFVNKIECSSAKLNIRFTFRPSLKK